MDAIRAEFLNELRGLPRWALVAFAARAAKVAVEQVTIGWDHEVDTEAVNWAIQDSFAAAASGRLTGSPADFEANRAAVVRAAGDAKEFEASAAARSTYYAATATAAASATGAMSRAGKALGFSSSTNYDADVIAAAASAAERAVAASSSTGIEKNREALLNDIALLKTAAKRERWTDDSPVSAEVFKP
jgi:hypothetical protein